MLSLSKNVYPGKLIVFEGTDGAGKSTLIEMTHQFLSMNYGEENVLVQKLPTDLSRKTRLFQKMMYSKDNAEISYRAVQLLTLSDRVQHNIEIIIPALKDGKFVICDRYIYTSVVNMLARGYRHEKWFFSACREIIRPDLAILAYAEPEIAIERIESRPEEKGRYLNKELLEKVAEGFLRYSRKFGLNVVRTNRNALETFEEIQKLLHQVIEGKVNAGKRFTMRNKNIVRQTV